MSVNCGLAAPISKWKQIEKIQKRFIMSKFKIKILVPYEIMLSETGANPIKEISMVRLIRYPKIIEKMGVGKMAYVIFKEGMSERKKTWMRQNYTWRKKWNIYLNACPKNNKELKDFVMENFHKHVWRKEFGRKKKHYIEEFNRTYDLQQNEYIGANIPWREKVLIAQLRMKLQQLRCEIGQRKMHK